MGRGAHLGGGDATVERHADETDVDLIEPPAVGGGGRRSGFRCSAAAIADRPVPDSSQSS